MRRSWPFVVLAVFAVLAPPAADDARASKPSRREIERRQQEAIAALPEKYRTWLAEVDPILTADEKAAFLGLAKDYQRDAFIKRFWDERDAYPRTARNEFRDEWYVKVQAAHNRFEDLYDVRARLLLLNGVPAEVVESNCPSIFVPLETWYWPHSERTNDQLFLVFYRPFGSWPWRVWHPMMDGMAALRPESARVDANDTGLRTCGDPDKDNKIQYAIRWITGQPILHWELLEARFNSPPPPPGQEWVAAFGSYSTDFPEGAAPLPARLSIDFPGRYQSRTVVQGVVTVAPGDAGQAQISAVPGVSEYRSHDFLLTGEVLANGELFDSFRYKFDLAASSQTTGESLPLAFQRYLRPGEYTLIVKLEDVNSGRIFREERALTVPSREQEAAAPAPSDPETARLLAEANAAVGRRDVTLKLLPPPGSNNLPTGPKRFDTYFTGQIAAVVFTLNGKPVLTKRNPPFSVELDLGTVPQNHLLTATAVDAAGNELASDQMQINVAPQRFRIRLVEPRRGKRFTGSLLARAELDVPEGQSVDRVEIFLDDNRIATLYQSPWEQPIVLPAGGALVYVRAVAYLPDGNSTEDLVFVNAPETLEEIRVDMVELYTTALDRGRHPVLDLQAKDFTVQEDGVRQEIARFERVTDLPVHVAVALDTSASMEKSLPQARDAALGFLQRTIRPKDRAAVITFNDHPNLGTKLTNDLTQLAGGLAGLKSERSTALYDAMVFSLYYFSGLRGRRALLLLSDGRDEGSRFTFEESLEYARRSGVTIYVIGLGEDVEKRKLGRFAEETGGRAFFPGKATELSGIYAAIEEELRSQFLIAYQSTNTTGSAGFRTVDLDVARSGVEVKTMAGYYP